MKIVYSLVFTLVVIFNSIELSTQVGSAPSSPAASSASSSFSEYKISPNMKGKLGWKTFTFPAHNGAQYVNSCWLEGAFPHKIMRYEYKDIPAGTYQVQASAHEAYGFLLSKGTFLRIYVGGRQAAVSLEERRTFSKFRQIFEPPKPVTRLLNRAEEDYLSKQWPTGYY